MTHLNAETIGEIADEVFKRRAATLSEAGARYELDELANALRGIRRLTRGTLEALPPSAFTKQPGGEGEEQWAAGQILTHISNSKTRMGAAVRGLLDLQPAVPAQALDMTGLPERGEALELLGQMEADLDALMHAIPDDADLAKSMPTERFGDLSTKGWLMLMTLHEAGHLRQLRELSS